MLAKFLPLSELQSTVSTDEIRDLAALLRRMDPKAEAAGYDPVSDKDFLARLYEAFNGPALLAVRKERRRLLDHVPDKQLRELAARLGLNATGTFKRVADVVAAIPWRPDEQTKAFLEFFGYPADYLPEPAVNAPSTETIRPLGLPLKTLREYQASVYYRCVEMLKPPCARVMIQMPTGSGKTRTAMEFITTFLNDCGPKPRSVLWLAHGEELCEQAVDSFREVWRHVGARDLTLHRCWHDYEPILPSPGVAMIVAGFKKLLTLEKSGGASPLADLIVIDEAHMVLAPKYARIVDWAKKPSARVAGLSATPGRASGGDGESRALAAYFNEQIVNIGAGPDGVIAALQGQGILARIEREPVLTNITFHLDSAEWKELAESLDYSPTFLRRLAENHERNRIVIERLWKLANEGARVLVFAASVEQSKLLCAMLLYRGFSAAHVDGTTSTAARRAAVAKFKRGELRCLLNYQVFSTGFDVPGIDVVFIARPTKSIVLYSQMIGRGMRGPAVGGKPFVRLIDVIDNIVDYSTDLDSVYDYFAEYWS